MTSFKQLLLLGTLCAAIVYGLSANQTQQDSSIIDTLKDIADCVHGIVSAPNAPESCEECGVDSEDGAVSENKVKPY